MVRSEPRTPAGSDTVALMTDSDPARNGSTGQVSKADPAVEAVRLLLRDPDSSPIELRMAFDALGRRLDEAFVRGLAPRRQQLLPP